MENKPFERNKKMSTKQKVNQKYKQTFNQLDHPQHQFDSQQTIFYCLLWLLWLLLLYHHGFIISISNNKDRIISLTPGLNSKKILELIKSVFGPSGPFTRFIQFQLNFIWLGGSHDLVRQSVFVNRFYSTSITVGPLKGSCPSGISCGESQ